MNSTKSPKGRLLATSLPWVLPAIVIICMALLQRHSSDFTRYLYALGSLLALGVWVGMLTERAWAKRFIGMSVDLVVFIRLIGAILLTKEQNEASGMAVASDLLFWSPAICAWWGVFYAERLTFVTVLIAMLFSGLYIANASISSHAFADYLVLDILLLSLVRFLASERAAKLSSNENSDSTATWNAPEPITGTTNRAQFESELNHLSAVSNRYRLPFALMAIAIDGYEMDIAPIDEAARNSLLKSFAWKISERLRTPDTVCYWAPGKFLVLLPYTEITDAKKVAESIQCTARSIVLDHCPRIEVCIGVSSHKSGEDPMATLGSTLNALKLAVESKSGQPVSSNDATANA